jgi:hypothetical protein
MWTLCSTPILGVPHFRLPVNVFLAGVAHANSL